MPDAHDERMTLILLALIAAGAGWLIHSWWLLTLPLAMAAGALLLLAMPGSSINPDNPLLFLTLLLEAALAAGITAARYTTARA